MTGKVESLKEYLIKLGWDVDELGLNKVQDGLNKVEKSADSIGNKFVKSFAKAGISVGGFLTTVTIGVFNFMSNVARADLATERWARRMWTTEENARSLTTALDAMGASYEDIFYMTPEEYRNMLELKNFSSSLKAPADVEKTLKQIRDINQEINKTKIIFANAAQWIAYYLGQYLGKDFENAQQAMEEFNNYLVEKLPIVTEKIAKYISWIVRLAKVAIQFMSNLKARLQEIFDKMPSGFKTASLAATAFLGALKMGPVGLFIAGITTLLLLLDDFYTWQRGGKSAFDWGNLFGGADTGLTSWINDLDLTKDSADDLTDSLSDCKDAWGEVFKAAWKFIDEHDVIDKVLSGFVTFLDDMVQALTTIADLILLITGNWDKMKEGSFWKEATRPIMENGLSWDTAGQTGKKLLEGFGNTFGKYGIFGSGYNDPTGAQDKFEAMLQGSSAYSNRMSTQNQQGQLVGGFSSGNTTTKNDNRRQTMNVSVNVKSYGGDSSDVASKTASGVTKALQDIDTFK